MEATRLCAPEKLIDSRSGSRLASMEQIAHFLCRRHPVPNPEGGWGVIIDTLLLSPPPMPAVVALQKERML